MLESAGIGNDPPQSVSYLAPGNRTIQKVYYVAVAAAISSPGGNYELSVKVDRTSPAPY
jgi:hypothetical protein